MAEFDPSTPNDATEAAYRDALLGDDDAGREQRRARLMAALPRPEVAATVPVSQDALAWRWQPYALGLLAMGVLLAAVLVLRGPAGEPRREVDPRLAAGQAASTATVVAQADMARNTAPQPAAEAPPAAAKTTPARSRAAQPAPVVVADARALRQQRQGDASTPAAVELPKPVMAPPPAAAVVAEPPPAAPVIVAAPPRAAAPESTAPESSKQAEALARSESTSSGAVGRAAAAPKVAQRMAAPEAADSAKAMTPADAGLLRAVAEADAALVRAAVQAGGSVHVRDPQGRTVLMLAARSGSRDVVDLLLVAGARKADRDPQGWTAADHAQAQGHSELAERLR